MNFSNIPKNKEHRSAVNTGNSTDATGKGSFVDNRPEAIMQRKIIGMRTPVVQRQGVFAPAITINNVAPVDIKELEYGVGKAVGFSGISSCIGVIGDQGNGNLVGVHIPMIDSNGVHVNTVDANALGAAVRAVMGCDATYIVGEKMTWLSSGAAAQYNAIYAAVGGTQFPEGSGSYRGFLDVNGDTGASQVLLYHNGKQIWPMAD